jgi:hypothetical protein
MFYYTPTRMGVIWYYWDWITTPLFQVGLLAYRKGILPYNVSIFVLYVPIH